MKSKKTSIQYYLNCLIRYKQLQLSRFAVNALDWLNAVYAIKWVIDLKLISLVFNSLKQLAFRFPYTVSVSLTF